MPTPIVSLQMTGAPTIILRKGANIIMGRSPDCQIQFEDSQISRKHASIKWPYAEKYPVISDLESSTGLQVDDQYVEFKHLHHVHHIVIGSHKIRAIFHEDKTQLPKTIDLKGVQVFPQLGPIERKKKRQPRYEEIAPTQKLSKSSFYQDCMPFTDAEEKRRDKKKKKSLDIEGRAAILSELDAIDGVVLFSNYGKDDEKGRVCNNRELHELFVYIEETQRTGTLTLFSEHNAELTFADGKIRMATCGKLHDMAAVQHIFMLPSAGFIFSYSCDVGEANIDLEPTAYLRTLSKHATSRVARPSKRVAKLFDD